METAWNFVEKYYPNYYQCDEIARNGSLNTIVDEEERPGSTADRMLREEFSNSRSAAQAALDESNLDIYERAIKGFIDQGNTYYIFGDEYCYTYEDGGVTQMVVEIEDEDLRGALYKQTPFSTDMISTYDGWDTYNIITKEEYDFLNNYTYDQVYECAVVNFIIQLKHYE